MLLLTLLSLSVFLTQSSDNIADIQLNVGGNNCHCYCPLTPLNGPAEQFDDSVSLSTTSSINISTQNDTVVDPESPIPNKRDIKTMVMDVPAKIPTILIDTTRKTIHVLFKYGRPYVYYSKEKQKYTGVLIDLWHKIASDHNWKYQYQVINARSRDSISYFSQSENVDNNFQNNVIINDTVLVDPKTPPQTRFDILIGDFTLSWKKFHYFNVSFTTPFVSDGLLLLRKKPSKFACAWWIVASFTPSCWLVFFIYCTLTSIIIYFCEHWDRKSTLIQAKQLKAKLASFCGLDGKQKARKSGEFANHIVTDNDDFFLSDACDGCMDNDNYTGTKISEKAGSSHVELIRRTRKQNLNKRKQCDESNDSFGIENTNESIDNDAKIEESNESEPLMSFASIFGNLVASFWFGDCFSLHHPTSRLLLKVVKFWGLLMSSFYMANLTALRTTYMNGNAEIESTQDMWHKTICAKSDSFIEDFLIEQVCILYNVSFVFVALLVIDFIVVVVCVVFLMFGALLCAMSF